MLSDVLSQGEIDALLSAISTGEMDADELKDEDDEQEAKLYDFKRALRFSKDQVRSLSRIHENFARLLTTQFSAKLRSYVHIAVASVDQLPYEEFVRSIPSMTILNVFSAEPLKGRMLIEVNPNIAFAMLDRVLGGIGTGINKIENLTEIETSLIASLFKNTMKPFKDAWTSVIDVEPEIEEFEINTQFLQMVSPNETVIVISLSTQIGEESGMINLCLPHVALEPVIRKLSLHYWMNEESKKENSPQDVKRLEHRVKSAEVPLTAVLGQTTLAIDEVLDLQVGDAIPLDAKLGCSIRLNVGQETKFTAQPGKKGKRLAVQVLDVLGKGEGDDE